jgi:hypothetical protein
MSEQHPYEFPKNEHAFLRNQTTRANDNDRPENVSYQQAPVFDNLHGSLHHFRLPSSSYEHFDNTGTVTSHQHAFQPLDFDPQYHMQAYSGVQPSNMHAPTAFFTPQTPGQPWIDEIHPSYTPVGGENFDWTPPNACSCGWLVDTPFSNCAEQVAYANTPAMLPVGQYPSLGTTTLEASPVQRFVSDVTPRLPMQQVFSTRPASVALKVRNEKFKKDIATLLYESSGHNGHNPMRVSKTKKAEKADNNIKQEACWRCKRYRKAVSRSLSASIDPG